MKNKCFICGKNKGHNKKYCSINCYLKQRNKKEKLRRGICKLCHKIFYYYFPASSGKFCSLSCSTSYANTINNPGKSGKTHHYWKGDKVGYGALHSWVKRKKGKPKKCQFCGTKKEKLFWANKSHKYKRDINDWIPLCHKCHMNYDRLSSWGSARQKFKNI